MTVLRLIADDLTGALDSAVQFTGTLGPLPVILTPARAPGVGSFALDLACRDRSEAEAVARTAAAVHHLAGSDIAFKKIDSLLRGHWAAELAELARGDAFRRVLLAPAFPAQGRVTRGGQQIATGADGSATVVPVDPRVDLARRGLAVCVPPSADRLAPDAPLLLCDAASDDDLRSLVRSARTLPGRTLWCGTAGLARALCGGGLPQPTAPTPGPHLMVVGSNHGVTRDQIAVVAEHARPWIVRFDRDGVGSAARIEAVLHDHGRCLCVADLPPDCPAAEAADSIDRWFGALAPRVPRPTTLTVVGGETFAAVCRALGTETLLVEGEWRAGVPASRLSQGPWAGTACFSKSGAFGGPDWLFRLLRQG